MAVPVRHDAVKRGPPPSGSDARGQTSCYREFAVSGPVTEAVDCTWMGQAGWTRAMRILPDGCVDIVWNGHTLMALRAQPAAVRVPLQGDSLNIGLRLRCGVAGTVLGVPVSE